MNQIKIPKKDTYTYEDLCNVVDYLRAPDGCAWDRRQTHESLCTCMVNEAQEVVEAIEKEDIPNLVEELGDVLLQIIMHSAIGKENKEFTLEDVYTHVCKKLIFRHPHVFDQDYIDACNGTIVPPDWEEIKKKEREIGL